MIQIPRRFRIGAGLAAALALLAPSFPAHADDAKPAAPASAPMPAAPPSAPLNRNHKLAAGDLIEITVTPNLIQDLSKKVRLFTDGTFDYHPSFGPIKADGLTVSELRDKLTQLLKKEFRRPVVQVSLLEIYREPPKPQPKLERQITVLGAATKKGVIDILPPKPLRTLLAEIQPTDKADWSRIQVKLADGKTTRICDFGQFQLTGRSKDDLDLTGGEEITVLERAAAQPKEVQYVRIGGSVGTPGQFELKSNMTLEDVIIAAGKLHPMADVKHVRLEREGKVTEVNLIAQREKGLEGHIFLMPNDVIDVPQYKETVLVLGALQNPGPRPVVDGTRIRDFFTVVNPDLSGALNKNFVDMGGFEVLRGADSRFKVNMDQVLKNAGAKDNIALKTGDMIYVPPVRRKKPGPLDVLHELPYATILFGLF